MTTTAPQRTDRAAVTNDRVELGRYTIASGERVVCVQRVLGVVRLTDLPARGNGRHYIIERGLTSMAELEAIVADYLQQAALWGAVPAEPCCLLDHFEARAR